MPPNTLRVHTEYVLVKSVGSKVLWTESRVQGTGKHFPPFRSMPKLWRWKLVVSPSSIREFRPDNSYYRLYGAQGQCQRQAYF
ncbi:uncharacterized protein TNCV_2853971 [Trichonephila clavipes]|uniref:Uncharacterized protein n=1 Tax=Trichonephila clavipes TaxID=2585209 RepID=A0A8X6UV98_TRICX|nr:uncharacterized protein TNCV_2853971 [Trichonephila clavipes]